MKLLIVASLGALALGVLGAANAQETTEVVVTGHKAAAAPGTEVRTATVNYADLDLAKSAGLSALLVRIRAAATTVCSPQPQANDLPGSTDYRRCMSDAVNTAVTNVNNPGLKAMVAKR
ncbi:MAG TPA: UrcA family protein [Steroidobacteraceae bacterium]|jgi:UrcA family protein|nr:UrcA family protein [Steroidobacteraceae bacterium]